MTARFDHQPEPNNEVKNTDIHPAVLGILPRSIRRGHAQPRKYGLAAHLNCPGTDDDNTGALPVLRWPRAK